VKKRVKAQGLDTLLDRLWSKIDIQDDWQDCWPWKGGTTKDGYGTIHIEMRDGKAFRRSVTAVVYETTVGPLPIDENGKQGDPDHLCRNVGCANPFHLEGVTHRENVHRASPTHCPHDHEYTPENTYIDGRGARHCRQCNANRGKLKSLRTSKKFQPFEGGEIVEITWDKNYTSCLVKVEIPRVGLRYVTLTREEISLIMGWT
jgi:hypothetical protein